jgi:CAAX protease family protein
MNPTVPSASAGRILALYFLAVLAGGSLLAPPIYHALQWREIDASFPNLTHRIYAITALLFLVFVLRILRLSGAEPWGYGLRPRRGLRSIAIGFAFGLVSMGLVVALEIALGLQVREEQRSVNLLNAALAGCLAGFGVALVEETFFRGGLQSALSRIALGAGIWISAFVYALAHLLDDDANIGEVSWLSGFQVLAAALMALAEPDIYGALVTLFLVGLVLAFIRQYMGHIYLCIGLHAGWVAVIQWTREAYDLNRGHPLVWVVSESYDGIIGYLAALMLTVVLAICSLWLARPGKGR